jgi:hypothetical protein
VYIGPNAPTWPFALVEKLRDDDILMYTRGARMLNAKTGQQFIGYSKRIGMVGDSPAQGAAFSRKISGGYRPTESRFAGRNTKWGQKTTMVYPLPAENYALKLRDELMTEGERAAALYDSHNIDAYTTYSQATGATGGNVWIHLLDVYERLGAKRMEIHEFWWTDAMHASLWLRAHMWKTLSGERMAVTAKKPVMGAFKKERDTAANSLKPHVKANAEAFLLEKKREHELFTQDWDSDRVCHKEVRIAITHNCLSLIRIPTH